MHVTAKKMMTVGPAVLILCLGLPVVSQARSSYDSVDYRDRHDSPQPSWGDSRPGRRDVPIDHYSHDNRYYTDQHGDVDTMRTQENRQRNRQSGYRADDRYRDDRPWADMSDRELAEAVRDEIFWSPFVDNDPIQVQARQGVVTLQGTVEDESEMKAAVENAYEAGARRVNNRLRVAN